jgi:hypothetical protein
MMGDTGGGILGRGLRFGGAVGGGGYFSGGTCFGGSAGGGRRCVD